MANINKIKYVRLKYIICVASEKACAECFRKGMSKQKKQVDRD